MLGKTKTNNLNLYLSGGQFGRTLSHGFRIASARSNRSGSK